MTSVSFEVNVLSFKLSNETTAPADILIAALWESMGPKHPSYTALIPEPQEIEFNVYCFTY